MSALKPHADQTHDLGTTTARWKDVHADRLQISGVNNTNVTQNSSIGGRLTIDTLAINTQSSDLDLKNHKITSLGTPTENSDAATKSYVDGVAQGLSSITSARVATTEAIELEFSGENSDSSTIYIASGDGSGLYDSNIGLTIDGVVLSQNDRILIKNGANPNNQGSVSNKWNGIYIHDGSDDGGMTLKLTRAQDLNENSEFESFSKGAYIFIEEGTINADTGFVLTTDADIIIGTTDLEFVQFSGAGQITAGIGLIKNGNELSIDATSTNTASKVVIRDGSGNFSAETITANLSGNATSATTATIATNVNATANNSTTNYVYLTFVEGTTGPQGIKTDTGLTYIPSSNTLTAGKFISVTGGNHAGYTILHDDQTPIKGPNFVFKRANSEGLQGNTLGSLWFYGSENSTDFSASSKISCVVPTGDADTWSDNSQIHPSCLEFYTSYDDTSDTLAMKLDQDQNAFFSSSVSINGGGIVAPLEIKSSTNDPSGGIRIIDPNTSSDPDTNNYWAIYNDVKGLNFNRITTSSSAQLGGWLAAESSDKIALINFTGQHRCFLHVGNLSEYSDKTGMIVKATGVYRNISTSSDMDMTNITINDAIPEVVLSDERNQKSCFGVISDIEDVDEKRTYQIGIWGSTFDKLENDERLIINSLGEGGIWVCNINGNLENGDYITTCEIPGFGMKQDDDLFHNYTVAKITCDCNFDLNSTIYECIEFVHEGQTYRKAFVGCTYHCG